MRMLSCRSASLLISRSFFESLPADYQEIIKAAALEARDFERSRTDAEEDAQKIHGTKALVPDEPQIAERQRKRKDRQRHQAQHDK